jgi:diguanylate cyclase (GGDEF)-like protein
MNGWPADLRELTATFLRGGAARLDHMRQLLDALDAQHDLGGNLTELEREFHSLVGTGSTYGLPEISRIARHGEELCVDASGRDPDSATIQTLFEIVESLAGEFERGTVPSAVPAVLEETGGNPLSVILVGENSRISARIVRELEEGGARCRPCSSASEIAALVEQEPAEALIVFVSSSGGYSAVAEARRAAGGTCTIAVVADRAGFGDRVQAIQCGADLHFDQPEDADEISRRIHERIREKQSAQARILSVEDDPDQASFIKCVLESAGYEVRICANPQTFDTDLSAYRPDLIILDVLLPGLTGFDLARYVRQHEAYATLPIVFLSAHDHLKSQSEAVRSGGDAFVAKPVQPGLLLTTVAARLERARVLNSLIDHDGLTRLLTHSAFLRRATAALSGYRRCRDNQIVLAVLDIDHLRKINEGRGHAAGDRLLASWAQFLTRRLRATDAIGRYQGGQFAILLHDVSEENATRLLDRLLEEFRRIEHSAPGDKVFTASFSAGLELLGRSHRDVSGWIEAAERNLAAAKTAGRGVVMGSKPSTVLPDDRSGRALHSA